VRITAPAIEHFQDAASFAPASDPAAPAKGRMLVVKP